MQPQRHIMLLTIILILAVSGACGTSFSPKLSGSVKYYTFSGGKKVGTDFRIEVDSDTYKSLQVWLGKKRAWKRDWKTYAPQKVVESDCVRVNYLGKTVVLSVRKNKTANWSQFSCKSDEELTELFEGLQAKSESSDLPAHATAGDEERNVEPPSRSSSSEQDPPMP